MKIKIESKYGSLLFSGEHTSLKAAVLAALESGANLHGADLHGADLHGANLRGANLRFANLHGADLCGADLCGANLHGADLHGADLCDANLHGADLRFADLRFADLRGAKNAESAIARTRILPDGNLIGWKKCIGGVIVKLRIPEAAKRSHAFGRKCRAEFVEVLEVIGATEARTNQTDQGGSACIYRAGETVRPDSWSDDWQNECDHGIHFFITRIEAEEYI